MSQDMQPVGVMKKAKKERKKKKKPKDVTNHLFAQTTTQSYPHQICRVLLKSVQGFWLQEGSKSVFFYT